MAQGWHGDSAGHARAGQLGGKKSAQVRQSKAAFGEQLAAPADSTPQKPPRRKAPARDTTN